MARQRRRKPPALDGVEVKLKRAEAHAYELREALFRVFPDGTYVTVPEIHDQGCRHVYKAIDPPAVDPRWSAIIGDAVHNMRSALDHIAYGLSPTNKSSFPIRSSRPRRFGRRQLPNLSGGASKKVREALDAVQPYHRSNLGRGLALLSDLDNIDKHRTLIVLVAATTGHLTVRSSGDPPLPRTSSQFTKRPLEHGNVIAIVTYATPCPEPDPTLKFLPHVAFDAGEDRRIRGAPVDSVLTELVGYVKDVRNRFAPFFPAS